MLLHIADENANAVREQERSRPRVHEGSIVTVATLEKQEWEAFKARLVQRDKYLGAGFDDTVVDEDDFDMLLALIGVLERVAEGPDGERRRVGLTLSEIVRELQNDRVLSREFPAAARTQAQRLLGMLRTLNRVWVDPQGRVRLETGRVDTKGKR